MTASELARILGALGADLPIVVGCHVDNGGRAHPLAGIQVAQVTENGATVLLLLPGPHDAPAELPQGKPA